MATVWAGIDTKLDRPVAVKILEQTDPITVQQLASEARAVARLAHPNIVAVHDIGTDSGDAYLVMELVEGDNLQHHVSLGPMPINETVQIGLQICDALDAAHQAGVVHRDIKPANLMLTPAGTVKVCDFGIARIQHTTQDQRTGQAVVVGTSHYMAPEQATGGRIDARTDLYALGCVLYSMVTGAPPFTGDNPVAVLWQHVNEPPVAPRAVRPDLPAELDTLILQLLAKNPADRPLTARHVRERLAALPPSALAAPASTPLAGPGRHHARAAVVAQTRTIPAVMEPIDAQQPKRFRFGPAALAAAMVGAAAITALVIALLSAAQPSVPTGAPTPSTVTPSTPPPTPTSTAPQGTTQGLLATIRAQVQAGNLNPGAANDLRKRLDEIDRALADGKLNKAADKADELRKKLDELEREGRLSSSANADLQAALEALISSLPSGDSGDDD